VARPPEESGPYDLFVAAPMTGLTRRDDYAEVRCQTLWLIGHLKSSLPEVRSVYYAGEGVRDEAHLALPDDAMSLDLAALKAARVFLLHYPRAVVSGALVELGYAMALRKPVVIVAREIKDLPFFLRGGGKSAGSLHGPLAVVTYATPDAFLKGTTQAIKSHFTTAS